MSGERLELAGRRVLVTGAAGFIGGRIVERLVSDRGARVRAVVRELAGADGISRYPVEIVGADVTDPRALDAAVEGCDVVIHCAYGTRGDRQEQSAATVDGTRNLLESAVRAGVRRLVHLSTVMVYGRTSEPVLRESLPRRASGDAYGDSKLQAEELVWRYHRERGLPVTVIQPTAVYGPFGPAWTERVLKRLSSGVVPLIDGGAGVCNVVYIDDLAEAVLLAAERSEAVGEAFLISGAPVTFGEFYGRFERMLGGRRTVSLSAPEAIARWRKKRRREEPLARRVLSGVDGSRPGRALLHLAERTERVATRTASRVSARLRRAAGVEVEDVPPREEIHLLDPVSVEFHARSAVACTDKARERLGWEPVFDFETGAHLTERWARWANLAPSTRHPTD
jgi:nucleoside-diphosphate-sugar epimerase